MHAGGALCEGEGRTGGKTKDGPQQTEAWAGARRERALRTDTVSIRLPLHLPPQEKGARTLWCQKWGVTEPTHRGTDAASELEAGVLRCTSEKARLP